MQNKPQSMRLIFVLFLQWGVLSNIWYFMVLLDAI